jgi:signal transduction histidine kinase
MQPRPLATHALIEVARLPLVEAVVALVVITALSFRIWSIERSHRRIRAVLEKRVAHRTGELERAYRLTEHVVTSVSEAILVVDVEGRAELVNRAARSLLGIGIDNEDMIAACLDLDTKHPEMHELLVRHIDDAAQRRTFTIDMDILGQHKILEVSAAPLDGPLHGYVYVLRDVTTALSLLEMKARFVSIVSHEIRTPLTSLAGSLDLLDAGIIGDIPTRAADLIDVARESTSRLVRLVNDVLDLDRLESQRVDLTLSQQTSDDLFVEVFRAMQPLATKNGVRLVADPTCEPFQADHDRVIQVLLNLVQNALKFSPPSSTIIVSSRRHDGEIRFSVEDEGRGIPSDELERIFEPFTQVDTSDDRRDSGTGLGLTISRGIVLRHGGRIWAENRASVGSRFVFTLPINHTETFS